MKASEPFPEALDDGTGKEHIGPHEDIDIEPEHDNQHEWIEVEDATAAGQSSSQLTFIRSSFISPIDLHTLGFVVKQETLDS